jgi:hypothetical protein
MINRKATTIRQQLVVPYARCRQGRESSAVSHQDGKLVPRLCQSSNLISQYGLFTPLAPFPFLGRTPVCIFFSTNRVLVSLFRVSSSETQSARFGYRSLFFLRRCDPFRQQRNLAHIARCCMAMATHHKHDNADAMQQSILPSWRKRST